MIAKIIISNSGQHTQNKWEENEGYLALDCKHEKGGKRVLKQGEIIAHQSDNYRVGGKIKATDWLLNVRIPDGNQNMDQKSLVRLSTFYIHMEKPKM